MNTYPWDTPSYRAARQFVKDTTLIERMSGRMDGHEFHMLVERFYREMWKPSAHILRRDW